LRVHPVGNLIIVVAMVEGKWAPSKQKGNIR
jgi:hypothetical protein